jgi:hypothetical protein
LSASPDILDRLIEYRALLGRPESWAEERERCRMDPAYFVETYVHIYDNETRDWVPFALWPEQAAALAFMRANKQTVTLKARQLGLSWLCLADLLHQTQFEPITVGNVFSLRENEAAYLLGEERFRGMWERLPEGLRSEIVTDNTTHIGFANGSHVRAFPTSAGDSYAATYALVDEADLVPDLGVLLGRVKPSIDAGGRIAVISRANKRLPTSEFKRIYRAAKEGRSSWKALFLPWHVRPGRTESWYEQERADTLANTGGLDKLHEQYPATDSEALAPASLDKRFPNAWLEQCYDARSPVDPPGAPALADLHVYAAPAPGRRYVIGADPAEGIPGGDLSVAEVLDRETGEQVAELAGLFEPRRAFPDAIAALTAYYNGAEVLVLRNNHGHATIGRLEQLPVALLDGKDGRKGFVESSLGRAMLCDAAADAFKNRETVIRSFAAKQELDSIERGSLKAPKGEHDDRADAYEAALYARQIEPPPKRKFGATML